MLPQPMILGSQNAMSVVDGVAIERRICISRSDDENTRCKVSRAPDRHKDFSQCMQQSTTPSTSNVISPRKERTESSAHRPCRRGTKSSPRREPDVPAELIRALFGNVTKPAHALARCSLTCQCRLSRSHGNVLIMSSYSASGTCAPYSSRICGITTAPGHIYH
jgi:hypothetical protein